MKLKIHLVSGATIDIEHEDPTFNFNVMCLHVHACGYFMSNVMYIPRSNIAFISVEDPGVVQRIVTQGTETRQ